MITSEGFTGAWLELLEGLLESEHDVSPRGQPCRERINVTLRVENARLNVLTCPVRNLGYRFSVAEWLWIWFGHDDVHTIRQYNAAIAQFSDNGLNFDGAYGPPVFRQWDLVIQKLRDDPETRQAVISIFKPPTPGTKDVPCTLTMQFLQRQGKLHTIVNMRSSDVWLGLPYDFYNFSQMANIAASQLGTEVGSLTMNLGSSHLYDRNVTAAEAVIKWIGDEQFDLTEMASPRLPGAPPVWLDEVLVAKDMSTLDRMTLSTSVVWFLYARLLVAPSNMAAFGYLAELARLR